MMRTGAVGGPAPERTGAAIPAEPRTAEVAVRGYPWDRPLVRSEQSPGTPPGGPSQNGGEARTERTERAEPGEDIGRGPTPWGLLRP